MLPRHPSRIFRSRWAALLWAAGVLVTAVMTVGFGDTADAGHNAALTDATGSAVSNDDLAVLSNFLSQ